MNYQTAEYAYIDESGQNVDPTRFAQRVYNDYNEQSSDVILNENNYDDTQQQAHYRPVPTEGSQPLAKCSVLYLGTAISSPGQRGIDAIQEPLSRRYPVDGKEVVRGIETWLSVYDNGLQLQFARDPSVVLFYPIRSLVYCASIRFATRTQTGAEFPNGWRFVPLDSPAAARVENTRNPPLFATTFRRTRHLPVDECHCFVTKTRQAALALVQACFSAYQATSSQQDCSKVPLYYKVDDYGSKNKEIDNELRIVPAPDKERTLDYQTNIEGPGFFYKTDRIPIDIWQLWEHHKHDIDRPRSRSYSSSHSASSTSCSSLSSCHHSCKSRRRRRRRRLASIASISTAQQQQSQQYAMPQQNLLSSDSQTLMANAIPSININSGQQATVDPYAPAPNLVRVERIKDVNSGQDVFIRWVTDTNRSSAINSEQQQQHSSVPQQIYLTQPPADSTRVFDHSLENSLPTEIERLTFEDEHLRKSLIFDDRPVSVSSKRHKKHRKRNSQRGYEIVDGYFEDRNGHRHRVKLGETRFNTIKDYRNVHNEVCNSLMTQNDLYRNQQPTSMVQPIIQEQQKQYPIQNIAQTNQQLMRPMAAPFIPRGAPFYSQQFFNTAPLLSRPTFMSRPSFPRPPFWYRPIQ